MTDGNETELRKRNIRTMILLVLVAVIFYGGFIAMTALNG